LVVAVIGNSPTAVVYDRQYLVFSEVLANIGGVLNLIMILMKMLNSYVEDLYLNDFFIEMLFDVEKKHNGGGDDSKLNLKLNPSMVTKRMVEGFNISNNQTPDVVKLKDNMSRDNISLRSNDLPKSNERPQRVKDVSNSSVMDLDPNFQVNFNKKRPATEDSALGFNEYFSFLFCCCLLERKCCEATKRKHDHFRKGEEYLYFYTDFVNVSRKLFEIEIIKYLILDSNMIELFKLINRPTISFQTLEKQKTDISGFHVAFDKVVQANLKSRDEIYNISEKDRRDLYHLYTEMAMKTNKTEIEEKFLRSIEENVRDIFY
jgi:hypothetical protein